jgi:hypothetical protein
MSNSWDLPNHGKIIDAPPPGADGGGRPPSRSVLTQIRSASMPAQIFKILDEGDPFLQRFIIEKISFHIALFPYVDLPDQETH